ncbi:MAG: PilZ domain-containing protein [Myxococcaceae bacterium]|nr:PilZ domain-containing protein [Myxococcaceae bacterium]MCI0670099.1 PilZ domain-containing protein [Myxococcaceae bacterium]
MRERRSHLRFDKVFPVYISTDEGMTRGIARNISSAGLFVETREAIPLGDRVRVTFAGEDGTEMTCICDVRYQVALHFGRRDASERTGEGHSRGVGLRVIAYDLNDERPLMATDRAPVMH